MVTEASMENLFQFPVNQCHLVRLVGPKGPTAATWWVSGRVALLEKRKCPPESPLGSGKA